MLNKELISSYFQDLQDRICQQLEVADEGGHFREDAWQREGGGGGRSRVITGKHLEKGGVNFSAVHGELPEKIGKALGVQAQEFYATGVSIVLHPVNPMAPIIHMNVRYFELDQEHWWFGGGIDLTPHYIFPKDAVFFHETLQKVCDAHDPDYYSKFKTWADDYFYLKHRSETRGVGGIFFDRLGPDQGKKEDLFAFVQAVGETFCAVYIPLLQQHKDESYSEREKNWQGLRRGRYVEFNLVWDKGTKFGLDTDGRTESILMSLPPIANWVYDYQAEPGSLEEQTLGLLKKGIDWVNYKG